MIGLLYNEWLKSWYGRKMWLFSLVMLLFIAGAVGIALLTQANTSGPLLATEFAELSVFVFPLFVMLFGVVLIAGAIAGEFTSGTVKQLLIRPSSRSTLLFTKWFGNLLLATISLFLIVLLTTILGIVIFSTEGQSISTLLSDMLIMGAYQLPTLIFYMALATLVAVVTKSTALTIIITFAPMFFGGILQLFIMNYDWAKWVFVTHVEFFSNYHEFGTTIAPFESMWASLAFLGGHVVVILLVAHIVFQKKDVL
ncbi:bacitracin transport permease protein BcrC [Bacillus sp. JCM 19046]|nr:bacitracin transport permease protein BcrC [Bacillus sp. JCM 19045]GAF19152.1 bacitracin transport permease protein BcrC [Bacillus sp. JCM 19046]